jgi:hypothetical protein
MSRSRGPAAVRLLPAIPFLHLRELAVKNFATPHASGEVGNVPFLGCSLSRESNDRLEAKIDRLLSEHRIDPAQFDYREEAGVQAKAKQPNQRSAPHRAALPPGGHGYPPRPPASSGHHACACIVRRTSHSTVRKRAEKSGIRNKPGINQL